MKKVYNFKKSLIAIILAICISFVTIDSYKLYDIQVNAKPTRLLPIYKVNTDEKTIAISFDCAWGADKTSDIISILKKYNVNATFFMVSFWAEKYPDKVQELVDNNIEIGNHSKTHPHFSKLSSSEVDNEIKMSKKTIEDISKTDIKVFRPPFGEYTNDLINSVNENGMYVIQWDVDTLDWKGISADEISNRVLSKTKNGSIILCHNNADNIVTALEIFLPQLIKQGYRIVSVYDLIYKDNFVINSQGEQNLK